MSLANASAGSSSGRAEYVGTALNMIKPTVMMTNEMMYRTENCGMRHRVDVLLILSR